MFKIITPDNRGEYRDLIHAMHEMRYRIVVEEWGWHIPGIRVGYDKDQFDTDATVYVLVLSRDGDVLASSRLNPTTRPHMMSELFADYCDLQSYPVGSDVWECSRFVTDRKRMRDPVEDFRTRCRLGLGLTVWCLDHGVSRLSWLTHQKFYNLVQRVWSTEPLGLPRRDGDDWAWIPAVSKIDKATLDRQMDRYRDAEAIVAEYLVPKLRASA
ncbi:acyl-homoserine-lactone synthase [Hyphomonas jannaschiana]|jgi:acyl-homoserine lactone synthase|uniref:Acyl-homoserine-lactone synthase n=1 Tax=Hyphomonas jannaschiana VP2 TaxID=1280952 RepID=A0A059FHY3_9PROT|nr:acyl-homoserine-lactone synthase [Hyphomonas jannaschiana]KCZ90259.1 autoinducer synthesis protein [Hyphomonas jannaschiana VP2]